MFWLRCLGDAFTAGRWVLGLITVAGFVLWLWHGRKHEHEGLKNKKQSITTFLYWLFLLIVPVYTLFVAPYVQYSGAKSETSELNRQISDLNKQLEIKSPKLDGFINQFILSNEVGNTNAHSLLFLQVTIGNSGGLKSIAEGYRLKVILTNNTSYKADLIDISDTYRFTSLQQDKKIAFALKRSELISEKTSKAIEPGEASRGWIAFRIPQVPLSTNISFVLSLYDIAGRRIDVTNGIYKGKPAEESKMQDIPMSLPGSGNLISQEGDTTETNSLGWMPPELPPGCSNVTIFFGSQGITYPLDVARITPQGTKFMINDLPDYLLKDLDKMPNYSPRTKTIWVRWESIKQDFGGTTVSLPIGPLVVSNRFYISIQLPFQKEKQKLIMSDAFDPLLSALPNSWDRNFHTNYLAYEIVNEKTNPVLQAFYIAPNQICINGIFIVNTNQFLEGFCQPPQLMTMDYKLIDTSNMDQIPPGAIAMAIGTNSIGDLLTNAMYDFSLPTRKAMFKYPSNRNPSALAGDVHVSKSK